MHLPAPQWVPAQADLHCCRNCRTPARYLEVVGQFDVEHAARYRAVDGKTYCNIFASDVAAAMGCLLPHWWLSRELSVNDLVPWLKRTGVDYGWERLDSAHTAIAAALAGMLTVATLVAEGHGHIAVVLPIDDGQPWIAQAGRTNFAHARLAAGFGTRTPEFFTCR